jgi:hypothetical protein
MERIGRAVERQLGRFDGAGAMPRVVSAWPAAVGAEVARNAWPARIARDGTLHVHTSSSVWSFELGQLAPRILERLVAELGDDAPKSLRFAPGHLPEANPEIPATAAAPPISPSAKTAAEAASMTAGITDDDLRERVARAVALGLSRDPDNRSI